MPRVNSPRLTISATHRFPMWFSCTIYDMADNMSEVDMVTNDNYVLTCYKVGEDVLPDSFDENRWNEYSHGIHFFINKQEAIDY